LKGFSDSLSSQLRATEAIMLAKEMLRYELFRGAGTGDRR
jgi:hypothetical protein